MSNYYKDDHRYDDMIYMKHHQSKERVPMSRHDRAAQFAPFSALSGHEEAIEETSRFTDSKIELDESAIEKINETLYEISNNLNEKWQVNITYFQPDPYKTGGSYLTETGIIKKVDENEHLVVMECGTKIPMEHIVKVETMVESSEISKRISRIMRMEEYFDELLEGKKQGLEKIKFNDTYKKHLQCLKDYYENGLWLEDYESDERGELPSNLKRGVLSQDALYDFFDELNQ